MQLSTWRSRRDSNPRAVSAATRFPIVLVMTTSILLQMDIMEKRRDSVVTRLFDYTSFSANVKPVFSKSAFSLPARARREKAGRARACGQPSSPPISGPHRPATFEWRALCSGQRCPSRRSRCLGAYRTGYKARNRRRAWSWSAPRTPRASIRRTRSRR